MRLHWLGILVALTVLASGAQAHLCNNVYRTPDRIIVKPEKDMATLETGDQFRIFILNNYPTRLRNVRLMAEMEAPGVTATITPESFPELIAGQKEAYQITIQAEAGAPQGTHAMRLSIAADNLGFGNAGFEEVRPKSDDEVARSLQDDNPSTRTLGSETLARRGDPRGLEELRALIGGSAGDGYAIRALRAAGMSGNKDCIAIVQPILNDRNGFKRGMALIAMGLLGADSALVEPYGQDDDAFVAAAAHTAFAMTGTAGPEITQWLTTQLETGNPWVTCAAAWGCALAGVEASLPALDACFGSEDADLVVFAGDALIDIGRRQMDQTNAGAGELPESRQVAATGASVFENAPADRLIAKPCLPIPNCAEGGVLEVQVQHSYPGPLHNVTLTVQGEGVELLEQPIVIDALKPTQLVSIPVRIKVTGGADVVQATFLVHADELAEPGEFLAELPCTPEATKRANLAEAAPVGEVEVRIMRFGDYYGWFYLTPLALILGAMVYRWRKQSHS